MLTINQLSKISEEDGMKLLDKPAAVSENMKLRFILKLQIIFFRLMRTSLFSLTLRLLWTWFITCQTEVLWMRSF